MAVKKTVQIRVPIDIAAKVALVASSFGETVPEYVEAILRAALARDLPKAAKIAKELADESNRP